MTNDKEKENIGVMRNKENQQNGNVFMMANVQNYVKFLAQWAKNTGNKTEHDLNVWKKFFHNMSENREIEDIAADKLKYLGLRQVQNTGHRSQVIVLLTQKVSQTPLKANLRPNKFLFRPN